MNAGTPTAEDRWARSARALVVGSGGIGGCIAVRLACSGERNLVAVTGNDEITTAVSQHGLRARLIDGERVARLDVTTTPAGAAARGQYDLAILAVPPNRIEQAAADVGALLTDDGVFVSLANGLPEERLTRRFGGDRVVGAIVGFGASMLGPGLVEQTSEGGLVIGRLDGRNDVAARRVSAFLRPVEPSPSLDEPFFNLTENLRGARWSKLAINCAISSLGTIGGDRLGALMRHRFVRRLALEVMTEATQVAVGHGVRLEKLSGMLDLEWIALDPDERLQQGSPSLFAKHTVLLAVGARYRRLRSSMLSAIERGREPPVDFLNGEVVERAAAVCVPAPVNAAVVTAIKAIARGDLPSSLATLQRLFDETRPVLRRIRLAA